jgi:cystathionine beta-lyase/cystathionine gamma-synthase
MSTSSLDTFLKAVLNSQPKDWLKLTTHRLDIYNEGKAKIEFLEGLEALFNSASWDSASLENLPTAYDYIRLGHPLSCVLEWYVAKKNNISPNQVIAFSSNTMPVLAILRKNLLEGKATLLAHSDALPSYFDLKIVREVYGYHFETQQVQNAEEISAFEGDVVFISEDEDLLQLPLNSGVDYHIRILKKRGSIIAISNEENLSCISEIQHVRRRESIAMTPQDCNSLFREWLGEKIETKRQTAQEKKDVIQIIHEVTGTQGSVVLGSSGLSVQYAIMMGLIHDVQNLYPGKEIKFVIPPNCYGGTNDQARRVAKCLSHVEVMDLPVDGDHNMVQSVDLVLDQIADMNAVPLILVEIPTNPRVEVPDLEALKASLEKTRKNSNKTDAIPPTFILDQTFCPNVQFLNETSELSSIQTISYVSGSKFPSGGKCTAGYVVANKKAEHHMESIQRHIQLCDNEATNLQVQILAQQMPDILARISAAYANTREFVEYIQDTLPMARINFVPKQLAARGFTPSVFSLDLPTKGDTHQERETFKRAMNHKLIEMMITRIPEESKHCVSYGQLKGCYWTIPATSTQGTTKEKDKDYIARVSCAPNMNLDTHKEVFADFVSELTKELKEDFPL